MTINYSTQAEKLLFADEVAAMTRSNENTLAYWRHQGAGPRWAKLGRRVVYRESDVVAWIDAQFNNQVSA